MKPVKDVYLILLFNIALPVLIGYLTIDSFANIFTKIFAILSALTLPLLLLFTKPNLSVKKRLLKFGIGSFVYAILIISSLGLLRAITSFSLPALCLAILSISFCKVKYGGKILHLDSAPDSEEKTADFTFLLIEGKRERTLLYDKNDLI